MENVIIYSTPTCVYCHKAMDFFKQHNIAFTEKDVYADAAARDEMVAKTGQLAVPVIDIGGKIVIGFDRMQIAQLLGVQ